MATACLMPGDDPANAARATAARTRKGKTRNTVKRADIHTSPQPMGDSVALIRTNSWDRVSIPQLRYSGTGGAAGAERLTFHPMAEGGPLGMRLRRLEDGRLLRGTAQFADDIEPKGCLHVGLLRSPVARGKLRGLDVAAAQAATGVLAVFTAADLDGTCLPLAVHLTTPGAVSPERPILAIDRVRFVGEMMAAVVADTRHPAADGLDPLQPAIDPTPALATFVRAMGESSRPA